MYDNVLVTGGTGFVGKSLALVRPEWTYVGSENCNLMDYNELLQYLLEMKPDAIIHLAAKVGGIKENKENQALFFDENVVMNTNVIKAAHAADIQRVMASLSTCAFPDVVKQYPFNENDFFSGPPAITNFSYGFSKRMLHVQCQSYRKQFNRNYSTFCPSNIYGPYDNFDLESSHFVAALVRKMFENRDEVIEMWGTGKPRRQQLYINDLAEIIPILLNNHNTSSPVIVCGNENLSILEMCEEAKKSISSINPHIDFQFNGKLDGQFRKDGNNAELLSLLDNNFEFTKFAEGVMKTYEWYKVSRRHNNN